jgi:hypothetical protein
MNRRLSTVTLLAGVGMFLVGGTGVVLRAAGAGGLGTEVTTALAVLGMVLVGAGASTRREPR